MTISTVGLDLAKNIFQVHAIDEDGKVAVRRSLRRGQVIAYFSKLSPCLVGIEACGTSHYWARELSALGHEVKLMPPAYVKPYVKRGKTDAADAEAICEAVQRPTMRFVAIKSPEQQAILALHRSRSLLIRQRTQLINMIRAQLSEFGIVMAKGVERVFKLMRRVLDGEPLDLPPQLVRVLRILGEQLNDLQARIARLEQDLKTWFRENDLAKRLATIPGVGFITASAMAATVSDPNQFTSARQFSAWLGLTPRSNSSGGKERLGRISKMGDQYIRRLLVSGMISQMIAARRNPQAHPWVTGLLRQKPAKLVAVAMANKVARIAWVLMVRQEVYQKPQLVAEKAA